MAALYIYFASEPTEDVEIKGEPLTIYPQSRANTYYVDAYDGFLEDYNNNIASLIYHDNTLSVLRSGLTGDTTNDLAYARAKDIEIREQEFLVTASTQSVFTATSFLLSPKSTVYSGSNKLLKSEFTISIPNNTVTLVVEAVKDTVITICK